MATLQDLTNQETQLKAQLAQLETDKIQAAEQAKQQKLGLITTYENEAAGYRNQAAKANSDDDKRKLYGFADHADELANELRAELGLVPLAGEENNEQFTKNETLRKVNSLLIKAAFALVAFFVADFTSARLEMGFTSFALKSVAQIAYSLSAVFGGCWVACLLLFGFVGSYGYTDLKHDFRDTNPAVRLGVLAFLLASVLYFFANAFTNVN
ncbi:hypothetical protein GO755_32915 [Spirosoma sp. HMF4905]|uniref:Uncharacterized protein n=1 Tax=Spirosoma arboris TaxID=2682092 RepID=A0A7K1SM64_9BACT|nr:hypothetical protein [Spirosoma arboris]MVM34877.1 hypothetical protein [Spirosoma arboris]